MDLIRAIAMAKEINVYEPSNYSYGEVRLIGRNDSWELIAVELKENNWIDQQVQFTYNPVGLVDYSDYVSTDFDFCSESSKTDTTLIESVLYFCGIFNKAITYRNRTGQKSGYFLP